MSRTPINTDKAPAAIGPYSQAVVANGIAYLSGQIAIDPETQELVDGNLQEQTFLVMENIKAVLTAAGSDFSKVIKASIFLAPNQEFSLVNTIYGSYFDGAYPARETVWVHALPKNVKIEISMIAMVG
ncbi:UNVERIFIED_CONTAM: hypothetical protein GTU68_037724 [Idotea baltica]|nr:hypothetical protein [Idotea baltica]